MPRNLKRYQQTGNLHFITFSCYGRMPLLRRVSARNLFLKTLDQTRKRFDLVVVGYVVMPEHVHLLLSEPQKGRLATAIQWLKQNTSRKLRHRKRSPELQAELFEPMPDRFWQTRYYDFNVWTASKRIQKLKYMHRNPVIRGLVAAPEDWRWSSYRDYVFEEEGLVKLNTWPKIALAASV